MSKGPKWYIIFCEFLGSEGHKKNHLNGTSKLFHCPKLFKNYTLDCLYPRTWSLSQQITDPHRGALFGTKEYIWHSKCWQGSQTTINTLWCITSRWITDILSTASCFLGVKHSGEFGLFSQSPAEQLKRISFFTPTKTTQVSK